MSFSYARTSIKTEKGETVIQFKNATGAIFNVAYAYVVDNGVVTITFQQLLTDVGAVATSLTSVTGLPTNLRPYNQLTQPIQIINNGAYSLGFMSFFASGSLTLDYGAGGQTFTNQSGFTSFSITYILYGTKVSNLDIDFGAGGDHLLLQYVKNGNNVVINTNYLTGWQYTVPAGPNLMSVTTIPTDLVPLNNVTFPVWSTNTASANVITFFTIFGSSSPDAGKIKFNSEIGPFNALGGYFLIYRSLIANYNVGPLIFTGAQYSWTEGPQSYSGVIKSNVCNVMLSEFTAPLPKTPASPQVTSDPLNPLDLRFSSYGGSWTFVPYYNNVAVQPNYTTGLARINPSSTVSITTLNNGNFTVGTEINLTCNTVGADDLIISQTYINNFF